MPSRRRVRAKKGGLIKKLRKPMAPPARIHKDVKEYRRERERERLRRQPKLDES